MPSRTSREASIKLARISKLVRSTAKPRYRAPSTNLVVKLSFVVMVQFVSGELGARELGVGRGECEIRECVVVGMNLIALRQVSHSRLLPQRLKAIFAFGAASIFPISSSSSWFAPSIRRSDRCPT